MCRSSGFPTGPCAGLAAATAQRLYLPGNIDIRGRELCASRSYLSFQLGSSHRVHSVGLVFQKEVVD